MFRGTGRGRMTAAGSRGGNGIGFRGSSPPWPYVGRGRGGLPRCAYSTGTGTNTVITPGNRPMGQEEELSYLKKQAQTIKNELERINSRLQGLEPENQGK